MGSPVKSIIFAIVLTWILGVVCDARHRKRWDFHASAIQTVVSQLAAMDVDGQTHDPLSTYNQAGLDALASGDTALARHAFSVANSLDPSNPVVLYNLGVVSKEEHDLVASIEHLTQSMVASSARGEPPLPQTLFNLARTHQILADDGTSQGHFHNATARKLSLVLAKNLLVDFLRLTEHDDLPDADAVRSLEEVLYQVRRQYKLAHPTVAHSFILKIGD